MCEQKDVLINGGIFVFAVYWASKSTYSPWQPLMLGILIFFIRANYKVSNQLRGVGESTTLALDTTRLTDVRGDPS